MGDRILITTKQEYEEYGRHAMCIYLHWGGSDIEEMLTELRSVGYRTLDYDHSYGFARMVGWFCDYFEIKKNSTVGVGRIKDYNLDWLDNGVIILDRNFEIVQWGI